MGFLSPSFAYQGNFDPTSLVLTGYWRDYTGSPPWVGVASAGVSGGRDLTQSSAPKNPTAGSKLNGIASARGTTLADTGLVTTNDATNYMTFGVSGNCFGSGWSFLLEPVSTEVSGGLQISDGSGVNVLLENYQAIAAASPVSIGLTIAGLKSVPATSPPFDPVLGTGRVKALLIQWAAISDAHDPLLQQHYVKARFNGGPWLITTFTTDSFKAPGVGQKLWLGSDGGGGMNPMVGDHWEHAISNRIITPREFDLVRGYVSRRYGVAV